MRFKILFLFAILLPATSFAAAVKCQKIGSPSSSYTVYESGRCPVGMITIGTVDSSDRPNLRFSESLFQNQREAYQGAGSLGQQLGNNINNLFSGGSQQRGTPVQNKLETIKLIDELKTMGSISAAEAKRLKAQVINE